MRISKNLTPRFRAERNWEREEAYTGFNCPTERPRHVPCPLHPACLQSLAKQQRYHTRPEPPDTPPPIRPQAHGYLTQADAAAARSGVQSSRLALHGGGSLSHTGVGDTTRLRNELELVVVGCRGLPSRGGRPGQGNVAPAAYVHYQVMIHEKMFARDFSRKFRRSHLRLPGH